MIGRYEWLVRGSPTRALECMARETNGLGRYSEMKKL